MPVVIRIQDSANSKRAAPYPPGRPLPEIHALNGISSEPLAREEDVWNKFILKNPLGIPNEVRALNEKSPESSAKDKEVWNKPIHESALGISEDPVLPASYLDIELPEVYGEVPCYETATIVRHKINDLIAKKTPIPGSNKVFNKTTLCQELGKIAEAHHPVKTVVGTSNRGPGIPSLNRFLKKTGALGGGDSQTYYYGTMLLEKLRIWNREKRTKGREKVI